MSYTPLPNILVLFTVLLFFLPSSTYAFGAGDIPDFSYLNDKAYRHGDIENVLTELVKSYGQSSGASLLGLATSLLSAAAGGAKFTKDDVKRVYFGNWLRDYSQAMDVAGLSKLTSDTIVLIISVLGFLTFGFVTDEFQITTDRLGVYLPVEHIDNPKGYAAKEGDARNFHPKLRPPVNPEELRIDPRTGMKNYMATENRGWDTSTAHIRRVLRACIEHGRRARGREGEELWEAYRLLGSGLHTLEDLLAHSNWCEIALRKMGHSGIFCHVGDNVVVNTPNGPAPPLVTGTFGSADFIHSLMGEATDHLSQASVVDLSEKMSTASNDSSSFNNLKDLLSRIPFGGGDSSLDQVNQMHEESEAYHFDPNKIASAEVQRKLMQLLITRDNIYRQILKKIEQIPGLSDLLEAFTNALNAYVYTILAPYLTPILQQVTSALGEGSKAIIDTDDQYEVFNNPNASDPSHSMLSKDHFGLILNEPAGKIAVVVVRHTVDLIVRAWSENTNPDQVIDQVLEAFHHPYYATGRSQVQDRMFREMGTWLGSLDNSRQVLGCLTKESVREGRNKRQGGDNTLSQTGRPHEGGSSTGNYGSQSRPSYSPSAGSGYGKGQDDTPSKPYTSEGSRLPVRQDYPDRAYERAYSAHEGSTNLHGQRHSTHQSLAGGGNLRGTGTYQGENETTPTGGYYRQPDDSYSPDYSRQGIPSDSGHGAYGAASSGHSSYSRGVNSDRPANEGRRREETGGYHNPNQVQDSFSRMSINDEAGGYRRSSASNTHTFQRDSDDYTTRTDTWSKKGENPSQNRGGSSYAPVYQRQEVRGYGGGERPRGGNESDDRHDTGRHRGDDNDERRRGEDHGHRRQDSGGKQKDSEDEGDKKYKKNKPKYGGRDSSSERGDRRGGNREQRRHHRDGSD